jgi:hypothetical protein
MYLPTKIFDHSFHVSAVDGQAPCEQCHPADLPKVGATAKVCSECHRKDMMAPRASIREFKHTEAPGMRHAMHRVCIECHRKEVENPEVNKPDLFRCANCHRTPIPHRQEIREAAEEEAAILAAVEDPMARRTGS